MSTPSELTICNENCAIYAKSEDIHEGCAIQYIASTSFDINQRLQLIDSSLDEINDKIDSLISKSN